MNKIRLLVGVLFFTLVVKNAAGSELDELTVRVLDMDSSAIVKIKSLSDSGSERASLLLGRLYYDGVIVDENKEISLSYLSRIDTDKTLLGEKYLLVSKWLDENSPGYIEKTKSALRRAIKFNNQVATIEFGAAHLLEAHLLNRGLDRKFSEISIQNNYKNHLYTERSAIIYLMTGLAQRKRGLKHGNSIATRYAFNSFVSGELYKQAINDLQFSGHPAKYLIFNHFSKLNVLSLNEKLAKIVNLLAYDANYGTKKQTNFDEDLLEEIKEDAIVYLNERIENNESIKPNYYDFCKSYSNSEKNKCLRLLDVVTENCLWPEILARARESISLSPYVQQCKGNYFYEYKSNIKEW